eukprot:TRINITY_DN8772_c0_g1_i1.p1 TRINITY_DN8772_c0_g1~~TRINITY_DN8772_c0_g1_i1.p1  ORF type:complete len:262 (-),score=50.06 TRINITY_DN8772_c0_g1_i1:74-859(-)
MLMQGVSRKSASWAVGPQFKWNNVATQRRFMSESKVEDLEREYQELLAGNKVFVDTMRKKEPALFDKLAKQQKPSTLWIGCSDSRVPANMITNTLPGEMFVHRNIANTVVHTDVNLLSVLQYAVDVLKIKHVILCGHYGCGGVIASMTNSAYGMVDNWLRNLKDEYLIHRDELEAIKDPKQRAARFTELHVQEGVYGVCRTSIVQNAWARRKEEGGPLYPFVHGWVYSVEDGVIKDLKVSIRGPQDLPLIVRDPIDPAKAV